MANSDRHYEPTIDLQGFDLTMNMDAVHEPSRLPLVVMIALVVLAAFAGVVWLAYTQGVERGRESVSRELTAQQFWKLRKPATPAYTGLKIYEPPAAVEQASNGKPSAPANRQAANAVPSLRPTATAAPDSPAPAPSIAATPVTRTAAAGAKAGGLPASPEAKKKAAALLAESLEHVATRAPTQLTKSEAAPPATTHPLTEPDSLAPVPAATPAAPPARNAVAVTPPASASVSAPTAVNTHAAAGGIMLQIGSYKSDAEARQSWQAFKSEHEAAAAYQPDVKQADLGAKGIWYRLRMGPFPDKSSALETCRKLKADGASCLLAQ